MLLEEMIRQNGDVPLPDSQWRNMDFHAAQSVEQIGSKATGRDQLLEALVRRDDDTGIYYPCRMTADALYRPLLNRT